MPASVRAKVQYRAEIALTEQNMPRPTAVPVMFSNGGCSTFVIHAALYDSVRIIVLLLLVAESQARKRFNGIFHAVDHVEDRGFNL